MVDLASQTLACYPTHTNKQTMKYLYGMGNKFNRYLRRNQGIETDTTQLLLEMADEVIGCSYL